MPSCQTGVAVLPGVIKLRFQGVLTMSDRSAKSSAMRASGQGLALSLLASTALALCSPALAQETQTSQTALEEIVVTAQKRSENLQNVPISIQAFGTEKLNQLQVSDFDDYVKFLPSVSFQSSGPGFAQVYFRGVANGGDGNHSTSLPSVGVYLDEQAITTIQGALDIHVYDIARVEALAGPQGTLYGASSQSGTLRLISNKPDASAFAAQVSGEINSIKSGEVGYQLEGFANIPLSDNAAIRLVGWYDKEGGYIDNVPATRTYPASGGISRSNAALARKDYNDAETYGARAALKIDLNDNWTTTATVMGQKQDTTGNFSYDRATGDLKVKRYLPESSQDEWYQAALTVEGKVGNFDLTYSGSYLSRKGTTEQDYSDYSYFYDLAYGYYNTDNNGNPTDPSQAINGIDRYMKTSHELRLASPAEARLRFVGGLFYQRQRHNIEQNYIIANLADSSAISIKPDNIWLTKQIRIDRDYAAFGELTYDITDKLSALGGIRVFKYNNTLSGFFGFRSNEGNGNGRCNGRPPVVEGSPCTNLAADNVTTKPKASKDTDFIHKLNLTYKATDDALVYLTWSRGFRPGGVNRRGTLPPYGADFLNNYEAGWKTTLADGRLRWNGAAYWQDWKNFQFSTLGLNGLTEINNAASARIKGIETDLTVRLTEGFTVSAAAAYNDAKLSQNYCGSLKADGSPETVCANPPAPDGTRLPITPKFKGNVVARYEFGIGEMDAFFQGSVAHNGNSFADLELADRAITGVQKGFTTIDLSAGVQQNGWAIEAFVTNLNDDRGDVSRSIQCNPCTIVYSVPNQPRMFGLKVSKDF